MRKPIEQISSVFDANMNNAMCVYSLSMFSENWIIF